MAKEKKTLIFYNRKLINIQPESIQFSGQSIFDLKEKSFSDIFVTEENFLDTIPENKPKKLMLSLSEKKVVNAEITRNISNNNEIVCVYIKEEAYKPLKSSDESEKGIYQNIIESQAFSVIKKLSKLKNTRNSAEVSEIISDISAFSLSLHDLLTAKVTNQYTTYDVDYVYTDLSEYIPECITKIKKENPDFKLNVTPSVILPFGTNIDKEAFYELLRKTTLYLTEKSNDNAVYFDIVADAEELKINISKTSSFYEFLKLSKENYTEADEVEKILELNKLARKTDAEFSCTRYQNDIDLFTVLFKNQEKCRFLEDE